MKDETQYVFVIQVDPNGRVGGVIGEAFQSMPMDEHRAEAIRRFFLKLGWACTELEMAAGAPVDRGNK